MLQNDRKLMWMRFRPKRKTTTGFTLVELLTVIAIITVLTAVLIPTVSKVMANARRAQMGSNLRQVALGAAAYLSDQGQPRMLRSDDVHQWAFVLAEDAELNDAGLYFSADDPLVQMATHQPPRSVAFNDGDGNWSINPDFAAYPLSISVASGLAPDSPPSTTPIAWTRGLREDGTWAPKTADNPGVYGTEGGHVAFLDGHVEWHRDLKGSDGKGLLVDYVTKRPTFNIKDALSPKATILHGDD